MNGLSFEACPSSVAFFGGPTNTSFTMCQQRDVRPQETYYPSLNLTRSPDGWDLMKELHAIGVDNPADLVRVLEEDDPFSVAVDSPDSFECPASEANLFSVPDIRDHDKEEAFKAGQGFIYYQHLRKAGGTSFCEMASRNMPLREVPKYYCMPDERGSMATPPWSDKHYLLQNMQKHGHRITANEWDAFPMEHLNLPGAVFGTTFRWYKALRPYMMGDNYYVKTFCGQSNRPDEELMKDRDEDGWPRHQRDLYWSYHKFNPWGTEVTWEDMKSALEVLRRFHFFTILDFVDDEMWAIEEALGWNQARKQVLPHEAQAARAAKKSISAREALPSNEWEEVLAANVFDLLLFHWAKRVYLERSACRSLD